MVTAPVLPRRVPATSAPLAVWAERAVHACGPVASRAGSGSGAERRLDLWPRVSVLDEKLEELLCNGPRLRVPAAADAARRRHERRDGPRCRGERRLRLRRTPRQHRQEHARTHLHTHPASRQRYVPNLHAPF